MARGVPAGQAIAKSTIEQAKSVLDQLQPKPKETFSLGEAVESLYGSLNDALERGYSIEELAGLLSEQVSMPINTSSLKYYLNRLRSNKDKGAKPRKVTRKGKNDSAPESEPVESGAKSEPAPAPAAAPPDEKATEKAQPTKTRQKRTPAAAKPKASSPTAKPAKSATATKAPKTPRSTGRTKKA